MIRINLLPPEILQRRRSEQRVLYMIAAAVAVFAIMAVAGLFLEYKVSQKEADLRAEEQHAAELKAEAERYAIFEQKKQDLQARQAIADTALTGRINWSRLCSELSLVLPSDVWAIDMGLDEKSGLTLSGWALDTTDTPDAGHKAIAKMLVRLADLEQLYNVWLLGSEKSQVLMTPAISWQVKASVNTTLAAPAASGVTAPPSSTSTPTTQ